MAHSIHGHSAALALLDSVYASRPLWSNVAAHSRYRQAIVQATPAAEVPEGAIRGESSSGNGYNRFLRTLINSNTGCSSAEVRDVDALFAQSIADQGGCGARQRTS
jgi:hypothetical protein